MNENKELTFVRREVGYNGKQFIAPFINGWNVWDIPPREWTFSVKEAIKHAYELGWQHCNEAHAKIDNLNFDSDAFFEEVKK